MEKKNVCYLFVFEGYADWEPALATSGLTLYSDFEVKTFSFDGLPVRSMGNLMVQPDLSLREIDPASADIILLPGGVAWEDGTNDPILPFLEQVHSRRCWIAAICGATIGLAKLGYLNDIEHTSNGEEYLQKFVPQYDGQSCFVNKPAVCDEGIITANGAGMIEFTYELFKLVGMLSNEELDEWLDIYKSGGMLYKQKAEA